MFSKEYLQNLSERTGFMTENLQKQMTLLDILREISRHPVLRDKFALRGGTAINLFWFPLTRLSVDIDLNYIAGVERSTMLEDRPLLEEQLKKLIESRGITVGYIPAEEHAGGTWRLRAPSVFGGNFTLELDLNYIMRVPVFDVYARQPHMLDKDYTFTFNSVAFEELFAGKVKALLERKAARDLYDISVMSRTSVPYDISKLKKVCILFRVTSKKDWREIEYRSIGEFDQKMIDYELLPLLRRGERVRLDEMKSNAEDILNRLFSYDEREKEFLDRFLDEGDFRPDLIFEPIVAERIKHHPAVLWKLQNVRDFKGLE